LGTAPKSKTPALVRLPEHFQPEKRTSAGVFNFSLKEYEFAGLFRQNRLA
jgi:hypothetical protein